MQTLEQFKQIPAEHARHRILRHEGDKIKFHHREDTEAGDFFSALYFDCRLLSSPPLRIMF